MYIAHQDYSDGAAPAAKGLWLFPLIVLCLAGLYGVDLCGGGGLFAPVENGFAFNSMATHMLAGRFDVDPDTISFEGFARAGRIYSYFGPFVGIVRMPLAPFIDFATTDLTRLFCLLTAVASAAIRLAAVRLVWNRVPRSPRRDIICLWLGAALLLGGPTIQFLKPSIYQEVIGWADLWATAFVYLTLKALLSKSGFTTERLAGLAALAGLALLTRVSTAVGLYAALGLLLIVLAHPARSRLGFGGYMAAWCGRVIDPRRGGLAIIMLLSFAVLTGFVNYERWGNPVTFADYHDYIVNQSIYLDRMPRLKLYGEFNFQRIPYGLIYYFFPVWAVQTHGGYFLEAGMNRLIESVELPPASFLLTDPLLLILGSVFLRYAWRWRSTGAFDMSKALAPLAGFAVPPLLMLMAISMCFRYRMEFYPFFEFAALAGTAAVCSASGKITRLQRLGVVLLCFIGILGTNVTLIAYKASPFGPFQNAVGMLGVDRYP